MLDFSLPVGDEAFKILVGDLDITRTVVSFNPHHPLAEIYTPLVWQGAIELAGLIDMSGFAESFDDIENPTRWEPGRHPVKLYFGDQLWQTFRIAPNGYQYEEDEAGDTFTATIQLTDILGLLDTYTPPQNAPGITLKSGTHWGEAAQKSIQAAATKAGVMVTVEAPDLEIGDRFATPKTIRESFVKQAQEWAGERGYWCWSDNEVIKWAKYPETGTPIYQRTRRSVDEFDRQPGLDKPVNKVTVVCASDRPSNIPSPQIDISEQYEVDGGVESVIQRTTTITYSSDSGVFPVEFSETPPNVSGFKKTFKLVKLELPLNRVMPDKFPNDSSLIVAQIDTEKSIFRPDDGFLMFEGRLTKACFGSVAPHLGSSTEQVTQQTTEIKYTYHPATKVLKSIETTTKQPVHGAFKDEQPPFDDTPVTVTKTIETWTPKQVSFQVFGGDPGDFPPPEPGYSYKRSQLVPVGILYPNEYPPIQENGSINPAALGLGNDLKNGTSQSDTQPPQPRTMPAETPITQVPLKGAKSFNFATPNPFVPTEEVFEARSLVDKAGCVRLSGHLGQQRWQRYHSRKVSEPYSSVVFDYKPFQIVHIKNGAYIRDGWALVMGEGNGGREIAIEYVGNLLGKIPVVTDPLAPPALPQSVLYEALEWEINLGRSGVGSFVEDYDSTLVGIGSTVGRSGVGSFVESIATTTSWRSLDATEYRNLNSATYRDLEA